MPGIKKDSILTCNDLQVSFYNTCFNPPVLQDPYEIFYYISQVKATLCCSEAILQETIDSIPLRSGVGKYYVPSLPRDLDLGTYKVHWKFKNTVSDVYQECCMDFVLYQDYGCSPVQSMPSSCVCFSGR